jgi:anaerobic magnesium-protoporphyrin IX monomethyl ester cyclase
VSLKLACINPPRVEGYAVVREERFEHKDIGSVYPPLSLLYCAAVAERGGHQATMFDANGQDLGFDAVLAHLNEQKPQVVLIRLGFDTQEPDIRVLKAAKELGALTLARCKIVADVPWLVEDFMKAHPYVDGFFLDEPECLLEAALKAAEQGGLNAEALRNVPGLILNLAGGTFVTPSLDKLPAPDELPFPAYHLLPSLKAYHTGVMRPPFTVVQTSRGCPYTCSFCSFGKLPWRTRAIENVVAELEMLKNQYGLKEFLFFDDVLTLDAKRTTKLMNLMLEKNLGLTWVCCTRANAVTPELLKLMKRAGCKEIAFGIESGSDEVLADTDKGVSKDQIRAAAKWCHEIGILFYGLAIIGLPGENEKSVQDTIDFINEIQPFYTQFGFCTPFPNTDTYEFFKSRGFLKTEDWSQYFPLGDRPIIRTEALSEDDLVRLRKKLYWAVLLKPSKLLRAVRWDDWAWNWMGLKKVMARVFMLARGTAVR